MKNIYIKKIENHKSSILITSVVNLLKSPFLNREYRLDFLKDVAVFMRTYFANELLSFELE